MYVGLNRVAPVFITWTMYTRFRSELSYTFHHAVLEIDGVHCLRMVLILHNRQKGICNALFGNGNLFDCSWCVFCVTSCLLVSTVCSICVSCVITVFPKKDGGICVINTENMIQ